MDNVLSTRQTNFGPICSILLAAGSIGTFDSYITLAIDLVVGLKAIFKITVYESTLFSQILLNHQTCSKSKTINFFHWKTILWFLSWGLTTEVSWIRVHPPFPPFYANTPGFPFLDVKLEYQHYIYIYTVYSWLNPGKCVGCVPTYRNSTAIFVNLVYYVMVYMYVYI